jgi:hypothetical protein
MVMSRWSASAFGLKLESAFPLWEEADDSSDEPGLTVAIDRAQPGAVASMLSPEPVLVWRTAIDGQPYEMWRGPAGDHRFAWGDGAVFHLSSAADVLTCGFVDADDPGAVRVLCDTVLWSISLLRGYELLHAGAVRLGDAAVAIAAESGTGKTSLVAELLGRGGELLSDDILALSHADDGQVVGHPSPPLMNLPLTLQSFAPGPEIARLGDEAWVRVRARSTGPRQLTAICLLERACGTDTRLERHPRGSLAVLPHALAFPGARERLRQRFELLGDLVANAPVLRLVAGADGSPNNLADLIERELVVSALAVAA